MLIKVCGDTIHIVDCGAVAQLGARLNGIQKVTGSSPVGSTKPAKCETAPLKVLMEIRRRVATTAIVTVAFAVLVVAMHMSGIFSHRVAQQLCVVICWGVAWVYTTVFLRLPNRQPLHWGLVAIALGWAVVGIKFLLGQESLVGNGFAVLGVFLILAGFLCGARTLTQHRSSDAGAEDAPMLEDEPSSN